MGAKMGITEARKQIAAIDRLIDKNRAGANDKTLEGDLFRQRGIAQLARDEAEELGRLNDARRPLKRKTCPTCGHSTYVED